MAHKALCKITLYKALKIPLIRPRKSLSLYIYISRLNPDSTRIIYQSVWKGFKCMSWPDYSTLKISTWLQYVDSVRDL